MDKQCNIVKDLLPLYHEDLTSDESNQMIKAHLDICTECSDYVHSIDDDVIEDEEENIIDKIRHSIEIDKRNSVIISVLISVILVTLISFALTAPEYLSYDEQSLHVAKVENSDYIILLLDNQVSGYEIDKIGNDIYSVTTWTTLMDRMLNKEMSSSIVINPEKQPVKSLFYSAYDSSESIEIYGHQNEFKGVVVLPRLVIGMYMTLAIGVSFVLFIIKWLTYRWRKLNVLISRILSFTVIYVFVSFFVKGFTFPTYSPIRDISQILIITIIIELIYLKILKLRKKKLMNMANSISD